MMEIVVLHELFTVIARKNDQGTVVDALVF